MTIADLCKLLQQELNETSEIYADTQFKMLENYGSLSAVAVLQMVEERFGVKINPRSFRSINTVQELADAIGAEKFS